MPVIGKQNKCVIGLDPKPQVDAGKSARLQVPLGFKESKNSVDMHVNIQFLSCTDLGY